MKLSSHRRARVSLEVGRSADVHVVRAPRESVVILAVVLLAVFSDALVSQLSAVEVAQARSANAVLEPMAATTLFTVDPTSWAAPPVGGSRVVTITAPPSTGNVTLSWTASTSQPWLTLSATSGSGSGNVTLKADYPNLGNRARSATATIAGQVVTVTQAPVWIVSPASWAAPASGGTQLVTVAPSPGSGNVTLSWSLSSDVPWLTVTSAGTTVSGNVTIEGAGNFTLTAAANAGASDRTGTVYVAGNPFVVSQPTSLRPQNVTVSSIEGNSVTLRWRWDGPSVEGFVVKGGLQPGQTLASLRTGSAAPTATFDAPNGAFYVRVASVAGGAEGTPSDDARLFVNFAQVPSAPTGMLGLANGDSLALSWQNTLSGGKPSELVLDVTGGATTSLALPVGERFEFQGVPPGTYTFRVRAKNDIGTSTPSTPVTLAFPGVCAPPSAPEGLQAHFVGQTLMLWWDPPVSGAAVTGYLLSVRGAYNLDLPLEQREITSRVPAGTYTFSVVARNACGASVATGPKTVLVPQ